MASEQIIIPNPSQEFLATVLKDPKLAEIAPQEGKLTLTADQLDLFPVFRRKSIEHYISLCDQIGVRPYSDMTLEHIRNVDGSGVDGFFPSEVRMRPLVYSLAGVHGVEDGVGALIVRTVNKRLSKGGKPHFIRYEFDGGSLGALNDDLPERLRDQYRMVGMSMVLKTGPRVQPVHSLFEDARLDVNLLTLVYGPHNELVLRSHGGETLDEFSDIAEWFDRLAS